MTVSDHRPLLRRPARPPESSHRNGGQADRRLAAALAAKGYPYGFAFAVGAKHVDRRMIDQQLPADLTWAWQE